MTNSCNSPENPSPRPTVSFTTLTEAQTQELIRLSKQHPDVHDVVMIILSTGIRRGELERLQWNAINFERNEIFIEGYTAGTRNILMDSNTNNVLQARQDRQVPTSEFVLGKSQANVLRRVQLHLNALSLQLGISTDVPLHALRYTWAQRLANAGMPPLCLCSLAGWSTSRLGNCSFVNLYRSTLISIMRHNKVETTLTSYGSASTDNTEMNKE
jgi:integrase